MKLNGLSLWLYFQYEFEAEMEDIYRTSLIKSFKKQIDDGYFSFIMVDCINSKTSHYQEMWSYAKQKGFEVLSVFLCPLNLVLSPSPCTYFYKHELFSGLHRAFIIRPSDLQQPKHPQTFRKRNHRPSGNLGTHTITFQQGMP